MAAVSMEGRVCVCVWGVGGGGFGARSVAEVAVTVVDLE